MSKILKLSVSLFVIISLLHSCDIDINGSKGITEGIIKYKITYLADENTNPVISLMPSFMNMSFKDNSVVMVVEGWMGIFKSTFIKNDKNAITLLKILNKKYCYKSDKSGGFIGFSNLKNLEIKYDNETKKILDFECNHAIVNVVNTDISFDIYYTKDIDIDNPNKFTPFIDVPGVLMDFQIEVNGIPMHLSASEIIEKDIPDDVFKVPDDYDIVTEEELKNIFSEII
jgi:GLPGLI family protein